MIVCKITIDNQPDLDYNIIMEKVLNLGDFLLFSADNKFEILFASEREEINDAYVRKILRKCKADFMVHVYNLKDKFDFDSYTNQWVIANLDKQLKIQIERDQQPQLREINRKLELLEQVTDELIKAKDRYTSEATRIQQIQQSEQQEMGKEESEKNI